MTYLHYACPGKQTPVWPAQARGWLTVRSLCSNLLNAEGEMRLLTDVVNHTVIIAFRPMRFSHVNFEIM